MNNSLSKKQQPVTPGDAFLSFVPVAVPLGMATGLAYAAVLLMPQLTLWDLLLWILPLAGFAALEMLAGMIPLLFLYYLFCRGMDWLLGQGVSLWLVRGGMLLCAGAMCAVAVGYCGGLWQEHAAVGTRCVSAGVSMLLLLPALRGRPLFRNRPVLKSVYVGSLVFCLVLCVQAFLWGGFRDYRRQFNTFSRGYAQNSVANPLLPAKTASLYLLRRESFTPQQDNETFSRIVGKPLPEGCRVVRTGYYNTGAILSLELAPKVFSEFCSDVDWQAAQPGICFRVGKNLAVAPEDFNAFLPQQRSMLGGEQHFLLRDDASNRLLLFILP